MSKGFRRFNILLSLFLAVPVQAQIVPDATLPHNSLSTQLGNVIRIDGGTRAGSNLFHSFTQFNVPTGGTAFFNNALDVSNIFSRVTGSTVSNIDGILKANGTASLFLMNPNGIIFGKNAQLNIGGSFLGTTASSIKFTDGTQFSAIGPLQAPLLTVSVPVGLGFGTRQPGAIRVQGEGSGLKPPSSLFLPIVLPKDSTNLFVQPGKTLALVGGDIILDGARLSAPSGQVYLGGVNSGNVDFSNWDIHYGGVSSFKDIQLLHQALINTSGISGGYIQLQGNQIKITDGSFLAIENQGTKNSGDIRINALSSLELSGVSPTTGLPSRLLTRTISMGNGGNIIISARQLLAQDGGAIDTETFFSNGKAGDVILKVPESVDIVGYSPIRTSYSSSIISFSSGNGRTGDVTLITGRLNVADGGLIASNTLGAGNGGNIFLKADSITVSSSLFIDKLGLVNDAISSINSGTFGKGNAGDIAIDTNSLLLDNAGRINSSTIAYGNSGNITIYAANFVKVQNSPLLPKLIGGINSAAIAISPIAQQIFNAPPIPVGKSGNLTIFTGRLVVNNGALVNVKNEGLGDAGTLQINASSINLNNRGDITAAALSGTGGNISLNVSSIQLRNNSEITATAGSAGNGGNIDINANTIVSLENSGILANAYKGKGGNIQINTQGLFSSPDSRITASSQLGVNGTVNIRNLGFDVRSTLTPSTPNFSATEQLIVGSCLARRNVERGRFIITGKGGLTVNPSTPIDDTWRLLSEPSQPVNSKVEQPTPPDVSLPDSASAFAEHHHEWKIGDPIVEARGIVRTADGKILLSSTSPSKLEAVEELTCQRDNEDKPKS